MIYPDSTPNRGRDSRTRLALVTGASSGIGRAFAVPSVKVHPLVADLGTDVGVEAVDDVCEREELAMLVNNAGVAALHAVHRAASQQGERASPCESRRAEDAGTSRGPRHDRERRRRNPQRVGHACVQWLPLRITSL